MPAQDIMTEEQFQEERRKGIGGSDWAQTTELGDRCTRALVLDKRGVEPDYPIDVVKLGYFERGHELEPIVCAKAERELGIKLRAPGKPPKTDLPRWWIGNPDRRIVGGGLLEAKTKGPFPFKALQRTGLPVGELLQGIHYLQLYQQPFCLHFALEPVTFAWLDTRIQPGPIGLIEDMIRLGERIMRMVTEGPLPERLDASSRLCQSCPWRWSCQGDALFAAGDISLEEGQVVEVEEGDLLDIQAEILEVKQLKKELEAQEDDLNARAKKIIGGPGKILVAGRAVHWLQYTQHRLMGDRLRKERPKLAAKYTETKTVERMRWY